MSQLFTAHLSVIVPCEFWRVLIPRWMTLIKMSPASTSRPVTSRSQNLTRGEWGEWGWSRHKSHAHNGVWRAGGALRSHSRVALVDRLTILGATDLGDRGERGSREFDLVRRAEKHRLGRRHGCGCRCTLFSSLTSQEATGLYREYTHTQHSRVERRAIVLVEARAVQQVVGLERAHQLRADLDHVRGDGPGDLGAQIVAREAGRGDP